MSNAARMYFALLGNFAGAPVETLLHTEENVVMVTEENAVIELEPQ